MCSTKENMKEHTVMSRGPHRFGMLRKCFHFYLG